MTYALDTTQAKAADSFSTSIRESGKYIGVITRAEAIVSTNGTKGLGLSFKASDGAAADYLDLYTHRADGEALSSLKTVNAILACLQLRQISEGPIQFEKWDKVAKARTRVTAQGYPELMGKKIGFLLRKELETDREGRDRERLAIFAVFQAETELTASEILDRKTKPERLEKMLDALMAKPINDRRKNVPKRTQTPSEDWTQDAGAPADDDFPF